MSSNFKISPKSLLLNTWLLIVNIPGLRDVLIVNSVPLDVCFSIFLLMTLLIKYGLTTPNILGYIILSSSLFVLVNEGLYQWVLSIILVLPVLWAPRLVHRIRLSTKVIMISLLTITISHIVFYGDPVLTTWRIPSQLILVLIVIQSRLAQIIIAVISGFKSLLFIPLKRYSIVSGIIFVLGVMYYDLLNSRMFWNLRRFDYINYTGTGFMHSSSNLNISYAKYAIQNDRFNQVLSVIDFGLLDMIVKLGIILTILYLFFYFRILSKYASFHLALALFLINVTHGCLIHESLIWELFFIIEYFRIYGYEKSISKA